MSNTLTRNDEAFTDAHYDGRHGAFEGRDSFFSTNCPLCIRETFLHTHADCYDARNCAEYGCRG